MQKRLIFVMGAVVLLSGCAGSKTSCPLNNEYGYCASIEDVHDAAVSGGGDSENVMASGVNYAPRKPKSRQARAKAAKDPLYSPGPGYGLAGPIYHPAKPRRLWVAPWTDTNGTLHSGEYLYFLSPGHWNYGPMKAPGAASGVMGPVKPSDLGFTPAPEKADPETTIERPNQTIRSRSSGSDEVFPVHHSN